MSYLVFARKYRPQNFDQIIGQEHITKSLKNAISADRLGHAYIFSGPRGVGKTSCARILSKSLNCKDGPTINPCGKCSACVEISESRSLDVIEIDGASNRGIDDIRNLRENVKFAAISGKYKIYIIDEVHQITTDGFNALLKTLEEPPPHVKFIFATTAPHKVLPTIRSRCQRFEFRPVSVISIMVKLEAIVKREKLNIKKDALYLIARASEGSLRDSESMLDQLASFSKGEISTNDVISVLGTIEEELFVSLLDKIIHKDTIGALDIVDNFISEGRDAHVFVVSLIEYFRNLMIANAAGQRIDKLLDMPPAMQKKILEQAQKFTLTQILTFINILVDVQQMFKRVDSKRIPLEVGIIKLTGGFENKPDNEAPCEPDNYSKIAKQTAKSINSKRGSVSVVSPKAESVAPVKPPVSSTNKTSIHADNTKAAQSKSIVALDSILGVWQEIIEKISQTRMSIATYLNEGNPLKIEGNILSIGFIREFKFHKGVLEKNENSVFIENILNEALNTKLKVNFIFSEDKLKHHDAEVGQAIKSTIEAFKGKIVNKFRKEY